MVESVQLVVFVSVPKASRENDVTKQRATRLLVSVFVIKVISTIFPDLNEFAQTLMFSEKNV